MKSVPAREPVVYQKHDSFAALRHQRPPAEDALGRIRRIRERLAAAGLSAEAAVLVRTACDELLGRRPASEVGPPFALQSYVVEEIGRLSDEQLPRYLWYRYRYEVYPQRKRLDEFPPCLQIEPASSCNYRCVFCYQTDRTFTRRTSGHMGMMSLDLFKRLIDQAEGRCEAVTLASRGEPFLCPDMAAMMAYARGKFLALKINTNASRLTEAHCHAILQADVNTVVFSVDAASEPAYSRLRVGGSLECVRENIERFRDIRAASYPHARTITRVSGVKVPGTPDVGEMAAYWGELVDQVAFVTYNPWENTYARPVNDIATPCSDLWRRMFMWWDGTANPCDVDYKSTLAVGSACDRSLSNLWRSDAYERLRQQHLTNQRSHCSPCNRCTVV